MADKLPELKKWYDGYMFGQVEIFNPWSVINFVRNGCKFRPYWLNTSGNAILRDLLDRVDERREKELEGLLKGQPVEAPVMENIVFADLRRNRDALYMMLMTAGYLKPVETWQDAEYVEWARLQIPNVEIRTAYRREILGHIVPRQGEIILRDMLGAMAEGNTAKFSQTLAELLRDFVSCHDAAQPESFYHGLMLGLSVLMEGEYRVESNREAGYGRFDIAFFPLRENAPGVVLELKAAKSEEELAGKAEEALGQIDGKAYVVELARQGAREVWKYGIAFCGKKVRIEGASPAKCFT